MANNDTLLSYDIYPDYFDVNSTRSTLQILVSPRKVENDEASDPWDKPVVHGDVFLHQITIQFPVGSGNADLTRHPEGITFPKPMGWREIDEKWTFGPLEDWLITHDPKSGDTFVAKPLTPEKIGANSSIIINLNDIPVSGQGAVKVTIIEEASNSPSVSPVSNTYTQKLHRISEFHVGQLWSDKSYYFKEGQVMLSWSGSEGADYSLHWRQNNQPHGKRGLPHSSSLLPDNGFIVDGLRDDSVTFTLETEPEPSEHFKNDCTVWMLKRKPSLVRFEAEWQNNGKLLLHWELKNYSAAEVNSGPNNIDLVSSLSGKGNFEIEHSQNKPLPSSFTLKGHNPIIGKWDQWTIKAETLKPASRKYEESDQMPTQKSINISPDGSRRFEGGYNGGDSYYLDVFEGKTKERVQGVRINVTARPCPVNFSPDGGVCFITEQFCRSIRMFDTVSLTEFVKPSRDLGFPPENISVTADGSHVFAINGMTGKHQAFILEYGNPKKIEPK